MNNNDVKINGKEYGIFRNKWYTITHGLIDGVNNVSIQWDDRFIRDDENGTYTLLRDYRYHKCKSLYLSCLKNKDSKDCFKAKQYEIMEACYKYMIPWTYFNKE